MNKETSEIKKIICTENVWLTYSCACGKAQHDANFYHLNDFNKYVQNSYMISTALSLVLYFYPRSIGLKLTKKFEDVVEVETEVEEEIEECNACFATAY